VRPDDVNAQQASSPRKRVRPAGPRSRPSPAAAPIGNRSEDELHRLEAAPVVAVLTTIARSVAGLKVPRLVEISGIRRSDPGFAGGGALIAAARRGPEAQKVGIEIVRRALQAPAPQIAENAGFDGGGRSQNARPEGHQLRFDAQKGDYADLVKTGIIDPVKVVRTALQDASSVAGLLVMTEAMVGEKPKKKAPSMPPGGGMGGDMDF